MDETRWMIVYIMCIGLGVIVLVSGLFGPTIFNTDTNPASKVTSSSQVDGSSPGSMESNRSSPGDHVLHVQYPMDLGKLVKLNMASTMAYTEIILMWWTFIRPMILR
jgi:hypothetical protein